MIVDKYLTKAIHTFQVPTLNQLGFIPRVVLSNNSSLKKNFATDYAISLNVVSNDGAQYNYDDFDILKVDGKSLIDCSKYIKGLEGDEAVLTFSLIPVRFLNQEYSQISREELWFLLTAQDHYVEYYNDSFAAGILYQSGAFNYKLFSPESSTLIQAPKIHLSNTLDTYLNVINNSVDKSYEITALLKCIITLDNKTIASWDEHIRPRTSYLINVKKHVPEHFWSNGPEEKSFCMYAICNNATLLPLTLSANHTQNTLAIEHSLPPTYYGTNLRGPNRKESLNNLESHLFNF